MVWPVFFAHQVRWGAWAGLSNWEGRNGQGVEPEMSLNTGLSASLSRLGQNGSSLLRARASAFVTFAAFLSPFEIHAISQSMPKQSMRFYKSILTLRSFWAPAFRHTTEKDALHHEEVLLSSAQRYVALPYMTWDDLRERECIRGGTCHHLSTDCTCSGLALHSDLQTAANLHFAIFRMVSYPTSLPATFMTFCSTLERHSASFHNSDSVVAKVAIAFLWREQTRQAPLASKNVWITPTIADIVWYFLKFLECPSWNNGHWLYLVAVVALMALWLSAINFMKVELTCWRYSGRWANLVERNRKHTESILWIKVRLTWLEISSTNVNQLLSCFSGTMSSAGTISTLTYSATPYRTAVYDGVRTM